MQREKSPWRAGWGDEDDECYGRNEYGVYI